MVVIVIDPKWLFRIKLLTLEGYLWALFSPFKVKKGGRKAPDLGDQSSDPVSVSFTS